MNENYIALARCADTQIMNMYFRKAALNQTPPDAAVTAGSDIPVITPSTVPNKVQEAVNQPLSEFDQQPDSDDGIVERTAIWMINQIKNLDLTSADLYTLNYNLYGDNEASISISCTQPPTVELIQRFSFTISKYNDPTDGPIAKIYIGGLFINKKFMDIGSNLLSIAKTAMRSMVLTEQLSSGSVELWSVETAVFFYIKNGFVIKSLFDEIDPQSKVHTLHKVFMFAMKQDDIDIVKKFAKITPDNFLDFINYMLENTKYGKFFQAYFDSLDQPSDKEKSVMQSRFISSLFDTAMVYNYIRDLSKPRVTLKPLTM